MISLRQLAKKHHAHGCLMCRLRYTDACGSPEMNALCSLCRGGQQRALWDQNSDPASCCETDCRKINEPEELMRYKLAGPGPWYRCRQCSRTHSFDPRSIP